MAETCWAMQVGHFFQPVSMTLRFRSLTKMHIYKHIQGMALFESSKLC